MTQEFKRKKLNLQIEREFQIWLLVRIVGVIVLCSVVAGLILFLYARQETAASFYQAHIKIRRVSDLLLPVVAAGSLVSLASGVLLALFLPQKIAGPIYRIEKDLEQFQHGDLTVTIRLRQGDTLQDFSQNLNNMVISIRERVRVVKEDHAVLKRLAAELDDSRLDEAVNKQEHSLRQLKTD
ncbi:methyl-accepting chemotaxis protein [Desulfuromonas sp. KJ2020]|uniref:methyl-accepting chemotaxis protein n=1 Tax=Desulfuromonas sp. KJ2020 TaxID=2919173 RepID=UPI0003267653|nr:methyl-accepting chemotaxis protein [Desulfuromonas sp. KJ2020]MCP3178279.1 methyl-accepting chemotaxis protein [Desulfuromonas sp. KJ2020]